MNHISISGFVKGGATLSLALVAASAHAAPILTQGADGYTWSTITHAGNRAPNASEHWWDPSFSAGSVNYEYRMATTEVTGSQWYDFVQAYAPYIGANFFDSGFSGPATFVGFDGQGVPRYVLNPMLRNQGINVSWRYAARFCNWLHNDRSLTQPAFENGAYDTSTFTRNPDGSYNDQLTRHADARFWIPTMDEWVKAAHFDPNRYGEGQEGYWLYPAGQDEPLTPGPPGAPGAQTSAGLDIAKFGIPDIGDYPDVQSPWGLLDTSGGSSEWWETANLYPNGLVRHRRYKFSEAGGPIPDFYDMMDVHSSTAPIVGLAGVRLAAPVPAPSAAFLAPLALLTYTTRRRRGDL